ncbi:uncharacterized protein LOC124926488 [Impatiens glandulifera]|uniref:uncharacterized protein LOC124926488 n=1 Tax=Impatiens glandulifera TaxID=253017 RepID=UPI001FB0CF21|nr:uncharacterized protein LOC124926488 [Impatiens glandulifera]XP_047322676.1 uncharacterized protein LOC124926488 [Impatiens glandulifera]XP_047322677.1 uncharacterized protein LOC124926488 [Impatiens glandulifera]XP_047322678.1 uncharacterized protein LOC124926488 [Impatiens glandulifera]
MGTEHSASSTLPWIWVIEALAKVKEIDMSVLTDLVAKTPEITDDVGKDARNILLLKSLEDFQVQQRGNLNAPFTGPIPNIEIDRLTDHEDIRQILLHKFSVFTVKKEGSDLNSDIQTLIQNKRRSLPNCALERIKNVIREGHPILESLKKSSRLSKSDLSENKTSLNGSLNNHEAWSNAVPLKVKQRVHSGQVISMQGNLALCQSSYSNQSLQDPIQINHVSSMCKRIDPTSKDKFPEHLNDGNSPKDESDSHLHIPKKAKHAASMKNEPTLLSTIASIELSENLVETDSKTTVVSKVDKLDKLRSKEDIHDHGSGKNIFSKKENNDCPIGPSVCSLRDRTKMECVDDGETEGDSDGFDDEKIDIEMEKQRFLKWQCTFSEDTFSTTQKTEFNLCIKCNRDGQLLICSTRTCTLGAHPSCLGYDALSDDCRHFYCPFCSHSNAISEHLEAKKKLSLARKGLIDYLSFKNESQPKRNSKRYDLEGKDQYTHNKRQCGSKKHGQQKEPFESCLDRNQLSEEGRMTSCGSFGVMVAPIEEAHVGSECETEHNLRGEQITKKDYYQQAHSNLCRELVVYVEQEKEQY